MLTVTIEYQCQNNYEILAFSGTGIEAKEINVG